MSKEHFASIFGSLFPTGGKSLNRIRWPFSLSLVCVECYRYSIFLFRNIDRANTGIVRFEELISTLSVIIHGSIDERLGWIFDLYDLNKDGKLTRIVMANYAVNHHLPHFPS